jgi:hypothetical protein
MQALVSLSAARVRKLYGLVYPRDTWWMRIGLAIANLFYRLRPSSFRTFLHPTAAVESLVRSHGLKPRFYRKTLVWQVAIYAR